MRLKLNKFADQTDEELRRALLGRGATTNNGIDTRVREEIDVEAIGEALDDIATNSSDNAAIQSAIDEIEDIIARSQGRNLPNLSHRNHRSIG